MLGVTCSPDRPALTSNLRFDSVLGNKVRYSRKVQTIEMLAQWNSACEQRQVEARLEARVCEGQIVVFFVIKYVALYIPITVVFFSIKTSNLIHTSCSISAWVWLRQTIQHASTVFQISCIRKLDAKFTVYNNASLHVHIHCQAYDKLLQQAIVLHCYRYTEIQNSCKLYIKITCTCSLK